MNWTKRRVSFPVLLLCGLVFAATQAQRHEEDFNPRPSAGFNSGSRENFDDRRGPETPPERRGQESSQMSMFMSPGFRFRAPQFNQDPFRELFNFDPMREMEGAVNKMFFQRVAEPPRNGMDRSGSNPNTASASIITSTFGDVSITDDSFKYTVSMDGFKPDEVKIRVTGNSLTVMGQHIERDENGTEIGSRSVVRKYVLPQGFKKDTIKSSFDVRGKLEISGQRVKPENSGENTMEIPIQFSASGADDERENTIPPRQQGETATATDQPGKQQVNDETTQRKGQKPIEV